VDVISTSGDHKGIHYHGELYQTYSYDPKSGAVTEGPTKEYFDIDGNGRIDFQR
jgi:hypothetical protein